MNKILLPFAAVLVASGCAFAQGKVSFNNDSNHLYVLGATLPADAALGGGVSTAGITTGAIPASPLPSGFTLVAALYAGTSAGSLSLQTTVVMDSAGWLTDGRQVSRNVTMAGIPGGSVQQFQIFVTDMGAILPGILAGGTASYFIGATYFGTSGLFSATPGASITYPGLIAGGPANSTWTPANLVINTIPEPSVLALSALVMGTMLGFRRRR